MQAWKNVDGNRRVGATIGHTMPLSPTLTPAVRAILERATEAHGTGRLAEAEQLYKEVLQAEPGEPDANHNLGLIAVRAGRRDVAIALFQAALAAVPQQPQFVASLAGTLLDMGRMSEASAVLQRGFDMGVSNPDLQCLFLRAESVKESPRPPPDVEAALFQLFKLGMHKEVQQEARRLLAALPNSGFLWKILGASLQIKGCKSTQALDAMLRAAELLPQEADAQNNLAVALREQGRHAEAAQYSRRALRLAPHFIEAMRNLGNALYDTRDYAGAAEQFRQALALRPDSDTRINLCLCLAELARHEEALAQLHIAAGEGGDSAVLHNQMGIMLQTLGRIEEASLAYRRALERDPAMPLALNNLGNILQTWGHMDDAVALYRRTIAVKPDYADAHNNLGVALRKLGQRDAAEAAFRRALSCRERFPEALSNLGNLLEEMGRLEEALTYCQHAVEINPQLAEAHSNLGRVLHNVRHYGAALATFRRALAIKPDFADAHSNLGALHRELGNIGLSIASCLDALRLDPGHADAHSCLLFSGNYLGDDASAAMLERARQYGAMAAQHAHLHTSWPNRADPARQLRIGLVSGDLHRHPVAFFLDSVLAALSAQQGASLALHVYANDWKRDDLTARLQGHAAHWRTVSGMPDEELARQIHDDGIDILLDLSGHTTGTRLAMFAWKPAPVQASWLGYFATTGLAAMDYFIADPHTLLPEEETHFTEAIWRLPETRLCFSAPDVDIEAGPLPALANGYVTFGCCNDLSKLGEPVLALWARILHAVPDSRLLLKTKQLSNPEICDSVLRRFAALGIGAQRLMLEGPSLRADYFSTLQQIDIALDPFPYTGGTTTAEALWMGVPVLTLAGKRLVARQGVGLLANVGLRDWIASDSDDYLAKAAAHAADLPTLSRLRADLRAQTLASPLCDAPRFAGHLEAMLRAMWATWCAQQTNAVPQAS